MGHPDVQYQVSLQDIHYLTNNLHFLDLDTNKLRFSNVDDIFDFVDQKCFMIFTPELIYDHSRNGFLVVS